jgi:TIR domain
MIPLAAGVLAVFLLGQQLAFNAGRIGSLTYPVVALLSSTVGSASVESFIERRHRQALERVLSGRLRPSRAAFFISYRRDQSEFVASILRTELVRRFGESNVFLDVSTIQAGQEWPVRIREAILGCSIMLVLIGSYWSDCRNERGDRRLEDPEDWVRLEIETALRREEVAVVPLLLDSARMPDPELLPESIRELARRNAFRVTGRNLTAEVDALVRSIEEGRLEDGGVDAEAAVLLAHPHRPSASSSSHRATDENGKDQTPTGKWFRNA